MEEILIAKDKNTIDMKKHHMMKALEVWTFQLHKPNEPRHRGHQTARAYSIQADHPPLHTARTVPRQSAPTRPANYRPGPNCPQYPRQCLGPSIYCNELGNIYMFCSHKCTNLAKCIVHLNEIARLTKGL